MGDLEVLSDSHPMNFQWFNQAESETGFWFCSEPANNSIQCPEPGVESVVSTVQHPESSVQHLRPESKNSGKTNFSYPWDFIKLKYK